MRRHAEIGAHRERQEQRLLLAVFRHQADAVADGVLRGADVDLAGRRSRTRPLSNAVGAEYRAGRLGAAGADQPGDAQDLAAANFESDVVEHRGVLVLRIAAPGKAFDAQRDVAGRRRSRDGRKAM